MSKRRRERKQEFWSRVEQEGRREPAEAAGKALVASGLTSRQVQDNLVVRFQPLDGSRTRAWPTPDSWQTGRNQWRKAPPTADEERDSAIIWAYRNRKTSLSQAPTKQKKRWLRIAQKNPQTFYQDRFLPAWARGKQRQVERQRRHERPNREVEEAYRNGYDEGNSDRRTKLPVQRPPARSMSVPEVVSLPEPAASPKPESPRLRLCERCRQLGYAACQECALASDPGLELRGGHLIQVRPPTDLQWRRCEVCHDCFLAPRYGVPNVCPECRLAKAS
jgi:hypothetical protein